MIVKTKVFKIFILCLILNIVIFSVFYYAYRQIGLKNRYIASISVEVANASEKEARVSAVKKEAKANEENKIKLDSHFLNSDSVADFFNEIENLGQKANVRVELGKADFSKDKNKRLQLSFGITGTYDAVSKFTYLLENFRYEFEEKKVILSKVEGDSTDLKSPKTSWKGQFEIDLVSFVSQ